LAPNFQLELQPYGLETSKNNFVWTLPVGRKRSSEHILMVSQILMLSTPKMMFSTPKSQSPSSKYKVQRTIGSASNVHLALNFKLQNHFFAKNIWKYKKMQKWSLKTLVLADHLDVFGGTWSSNGKCSHKGAFLGRSDRVVFGGTLASNGKCLGKSVDHRFVRQKTG